ncbi:MAG TPA: hypothetical protein VMG10_17515 [Gemmataceae bacterium]|nr:hypothetical protein [Gemmataceae bacterium]
MRFVSCLNVFVCLCLLAAARAPAEEARAVLDRAIQAHGGEARLERTTKGRLKARVEGNMFGTVFKTEWEETFDLPGRYKQIIDGSVNGMSTHMEYAVTGTKGWLRQGTDSARDFAESEPPSVGRHWHAILAQLLLVSDKKIQLSSLPDDKTDGRTLAGIRAVSLQGSGDWYFDKATGLLARAPWRMPNHTILKAGQKTMGQHRLEDYHDIKGIHYPMKFITNAGKANSMTITISSIEFLDKIEASVFVNPQTPAEPYKGEETPVNRDRWLIIATASAGVVVGAVWLIVRASGRGKRETPPAEE